MFLHVGFKSDSCVILKKECQTYEYCSEYCQNFESFVRQKKKKKKKKENILSYSPKSVNSKKTK